jgi:hypothetical protein
VCLPLLDDDILQPKSTVAEGAGGKQLVWSNGKFVPGVGGVTTGTLIPGGKGVGIGNGYPASACFAVGSGDYHFAVYMEQMA